MEIDAKLPNNLLQLFSILGLIYLAWQVFERVTGRTVRKQKCVTAKQHARRRPENMDARRILG